MAGQPELASIVIPHFRTEELARLCLRAIRRLTDPPYEVIVVDNHSADASLEYLRRVRWIRLIERGAEADVHAVNAHADAMDAGMAAARGRWLVSLHTDTIVRRQGWLKALVDRLAANPKAAALGSDKIDYDPAWYRAMKRLWDTHRMRAFWRRASAGRPTRASRRRGIPGRSARCTGWTWCGNWASPGSRRATARPASPCTRACWRRGTRASASRPTRCAQFVEHISHATSLLGRGGIGHWRGNYKVRRTLARVMGSDLARELLKDDSLDQ